MNKDLCVFYTRDINPKYIFFILNTGQPMGSYAEEQILPANKVVPVPSSIDPPVAASIMLKGMTTHFLLRRCFKVIFCDVIVLVAEAILLLSFSFVTMLIYIH